MYRRSNLNRSQKENKQSGGGEGTKGATRGLYSAAWEGAGGRRPGAAGRGRWAAAAPGRRAGAPAGRGAVAAGGRRAGGRAAGPAAAPASVEAADNCPAGGGHCPDTVWGGWHPGGG